LSTPAANEIGVLDFRGAQLDTYRRDSRILPTASGGCVVSQGVSLTAFLVGLLISLAGLALLYAREISSRVAGALLAAAGVVFVFASPADPFVSIVLLVLVLVLGSLIFGTQWLGRSRDTPKEGNGRV
jgi:hypothetical protein